MLNIMHFSKLIVIFLIYTSAGVFAPIFADLDSTTNQQAQQPQQDWQVIIQQLEKATQNNPSDAKAKQSLAIAYNNYGVQLASQKQWEQAEDYLDKALAIDAGNAAFKNNLSNVYFEHGMDLYQNKKDQAYNSESHSEAKALAQQAIELNPRNANAYLLLGDIEYWNQNMDAAVNAWQKGADIMPDNQQIQDRLTKIRAEANTENAMDERYNAFFVVKIDQSLENLPGFDINDILDEARRGVDVDFAYKPIHKIPVLVYTIDEYRQELNGAPIWSEGAFDGKMRIVMTTNTNRYNQVKSTIVHEYTHAIVADLASTYCPRWFNEGIAKFEEYQHGVKPLINLLAIAYNGNNLILWANINETIVSTNYNEALLSYQQAFSFVHYLVDKYGHDKITDTLNAIGNTKDFNQAITQVYGLSIDDLQAAWLQWMSDYISHWAEEPITAPLDPNNGGLFYTR